MRRALAVRDMQGVYRLLQRYGVSQRAIATRTGQSQSEVSDILAGRKVLSYDLLVRIAELCRVRHKRHLGYPSNRRQICAVCVI
jgi:transcriptional regulator with XRE-family HTH domain